MTYATEQAAIDSLTAEGFKATADGFFSKRCMTQGNLVSEPRPCLALCTIVRNRVDPKWAAEGFDVADYFTIRFH
jgi:hypothetical protein